VRPSVDFEGFFILKTMAVVYRHRRLDTNQVFYVGIGKSEKRAYSNNGRNYYWKNITKKTKYNVEIISTNISWEDACELESFLISQYGRRELNSGSLVNMTDGGEGSIGRIIKESTKDIWKKQRFGKKLEEAHRQNIKNNHASKKEGFVSPLKGRPKECHPFFNKNFTEQHIKNISSSRINREVAVLEKNPNSKKVINIKTLEIIDCAKTLSKILSIDYQKLCKQLRGEQKKKIDWCYLKNYKIEEND
jgi:hypothetical protein